MLSAWVKLAEAMSELGELTYLFWRMKDILWFAESFWVLEVLLCLGPNPDKIMHEGIS